MESYDVQQDDYTKLVTVHDDVPTVTEVARNHEIYEELTQGVEGMQPLEWTEGQYSPEEAVEAAEVLESRLGADLTNWQLEVRGVPGEGVLDVAPRTTVTGVLDYDFEVKGYDTLNAELEMNLVFDESRGQTDENIRMRTEMDLDNPERLSPRDVAAMKSEIEEDARRFGAELDEVTDEMPPF